MDGGVTATLVLCGTARCASVGVDVALLRLPCAAFLSLALTPGCFSPTGGTSESSSTGTGPASTSSGSTGLSTSGSTDAHTSSAGATVTGTATTAPSSGPDACGDGDLAPAEECDDGNQRGGDGCAADCSKEFRRVFVTSDLFAGNLGGVAGANTKCQKAAQGAQLSGEYRAWLSTNDSSPAMTFFRSPVPYVLVDGTPVAADWDDLVDESLMTGIFMTELGTEPQLNPVPCGEFLRPVWTNTSPKGTLLVAGLDCSSWTSTSGFGRTGRAGSSDIEWTQSCEASCGIPVALYCFEQ